MTRHRTTKSHPHAMSPAHVMAALIATPVATAAPIRFHHRPILNGYPFMWRRSVYEQ
ncbi:hypothetical protein ABZ829_11615 [Streptomyces xanthochromogenes]|uniref:hypothetical protein n=1 Tax=Streptomyces xanthochromogenes TaxID=67384 RepID=UPI00342D6D61